MKIKLLTIILVITTLSGCATRPAMRAEFKALPPLEKGFGRLYISSSDHMWYDNQVGPVFINEKNVGSTAKDEHFVVDILPGTYGAYCTPHKPEKTYIEKRNITVQAGSIRYFNCHMSTKGLGMFFGLVGALLSEHLWESVLEEQPLENPNSKLVSYLKYNKNITSS